jgi:hypothetical protein
MGGFLGIGTSSEEESLKRQEQLRNQEIEKSRRDNEIRLAERKAKKGQETAKVKLGTKEEELVDVPKKKGAAAGGSVSPSLGIGGSGSTGVQL